MEQPLFLEEGKMTAEVYLLSATKATQNKYTYAVKEEIAGKILPGVICYVPFGGGNRKTQAVVWNVNPEDNGKNLKYKIKEISEVCDNFRPLSNEEMLLAERMSEFYFSPLGNCARCLIPPEGNKGREVRFAKLTMPVSEVDSLCREDRFRNISQVKVLQYLKDCGGSAQIGEIMKDLSCSESPVKTLAKNKFIEIYTEKITQEDEWAKAVEYPAMKLTEEQNNAFDKIKAMLSENKLSECLVHGVTGSGKTELYLRLIEHVISEGGQAIMLVPEISLTPQMEARFTGRFGNRVTVLHSRLSNSARNRRWEKIASGEVSVALGARSAVFAPFKNLKLIILDEEQELTYKSEEQEPHYHAAEIAKLRLENDGGVILYGSATPRLETFYRAKRRDIGYVRLAERVNAKPLPRVEIVNMRDELDAGVKGMFSRKLISEIENNLNAGKKSLIFVHRRGFSGNVICTDCGKSFKCRHCNIPMTYHSKTGRLICHYCGNTATVPEVCPSCGGKKFDKRSFGTEKAESELQKIFPSAKIVRMDADTTSGREGHLKVIENFTRDGDILLGTQMIAKGHDFPDVTLVGVVSCDSLINFNDYRASERTFQLLTQVAGRAGRGSEPGRVIFQALDVDNYSLNAACSQDYFKFFETELKLRESLYFPPFCVMTVIGFIGRDDRGTFEYGRECRKALSETAAKMKGAEVLNILRANVQKLAGKYRWRIIMKTATREDALELLKNTKFPKQPGGVASVITDIAPGNMF